MEVVWQVENDPYCQAVLAKHWPEVKRYGDITQVDWQEVEPVDLICGGFPCQPVSLAGKRLGQRDERWLWPEFTRCVRILRPRYVLVENVPGLLTRGFGDVLGDLAALGYDAEWDCIPAAAVGAPHLRYRVFLVAYPSRTQWKTGAEISRKLLGNHANGQEPDYTHGPGTDVADACGAGLEEWDGSRIFARRPRTTLEKYDWWAAEPDVGRVASRVPARVDRLKGLGNAVVPQVAEWIGRRIMQCHESVTSPDVRT